MAAAEVAALVREGNTLNSRALPILEGSSLTAAVQGESEDAFLKYEAAAALAPQLPEAAAAYNNCGNVLRGQVCAGNHRLHSGQWQGKLEEAIAKYREAIAVDPKFAPGYNNLGIVLDAQGLGDQAAEQFKKVTQLPRLFTLSRGQAVDADTRFAAARSNLGNTLLDQARGRHAAEQR